MTEAKWMGCTVPWAMLNFLRAEASDRKMRLFGVACCRRIWRFLSDARCRCAVERAESFADGLTTLAELSAANADTVAAYRDAEAAFCIGSILSPPYVNPAFDAAAHSADTFNAVLIAAYDVATLAAEAVAIPAYQITRNAHYETHSATGSAFDASYYLAAESSSQAAFDSAKSVEMAAQAVVVREIFGNPFCPVTVDPFWLRWHDGFIPQVAQSIYDDRRFTDLPILGDALEDAGCTNADILDHCRRPGEHVRGCWVVDLLLGKE